MLIFRDQSGVTGQDVMALSLTPGGSVTPVLQSRFTEINGQVSPDGRWIAYESDESGQREIYARPFPNVNAGRWQVSGGTGGAESPFWSRSSKEIFYAQRDGQMAAVPVVGTPASADPFGAPVNLFERARYWTVESPGVHTDVSSRGRFLMVRRPEDQLNPSRPILVVVTNWLQDVKKRLSF
jgi:eukaryotic-like serine/threonine-protein kinase